MIFYKQTTALVGDAINCVSTSFYGYVTLVVFYAMLCVVGGLFVVLAFGVYGYALAAWRARRGAKHGEKRTP